MLQLSVFSLRVAPCCYQRFNVKSCQTHAWFATACHIQKQQHQSSENPLLYLRYRKYFFLTLYSKSFWWVAAFARLVVSTFPPLSKLIWCPLTFLYKSISRCSKLKLCVCQLFVDVHFPSLGKIIPFFLGPDLLRIFKIAL